MKKLLVAFIICLCFSTLPAARKALVIGNAAYKDKPLKNTINDARDIKESLSKLGFKVTYLENAVNDSMRAEIYNFSKNLDQVDEVVVYYAGHGIQSEGENYLIPVGLRKYDEAYVIGSSYKCNELLDMLRKPNISIIFLDACRNNPFIETTRSMNRGLASMTPSSSRQCLVFSTEAGKEALDGDEEDRNSPFAKVLLKYIDQPIELDALIRKVTNEVEDLTGSKQIPFQVGRLREEYYLAKPVMDTFPPPPSPPTNPPITLPPPPDTTLKITQVLPPSVPIQTTQPNPTTPPITQVPPPVANIQTTQPNPTTPPITQVLPPSLPIQTTQPNPTTPPITQVPPPVANMQTTQPNPTTPPMTQVTSTTVETPIKPAPLQNPPPQIPDSIIKSIDLAKMNISAPPVQAPIVEYGTLDVISNYAGEIYLDDAESAYASISKNKTLSIPNLRTGNCTITFKSAKYKASKEVNIETKSNAPLIFSFAEPVLQTGFVLVEGGSFMMGSSEAKDEKPIHRVILSSFQMATHEVRVSEFRSFVENTRYKTTAEKAGSATILNLKKRKFETSKGVYWQKPGFELSENQPVTCISWFDAIAYCNWLSIKEGLQPCYSINGESRPTDWSNGIVTCTWTASGYRLPTEAEWEYAARSGNSNIKFSGGNDLDMVATHYFNAGGKPAEVGSRQANEFGIFDLTGNVHEWCWDGYDPGYYNKGIAKNPTGPNISKVKISRGGAWYGNADNCRVSYRNYQDPSEAEVGIGFRLVKNVPTGL